MGPDIPIRSRSRAMELHAAFSPVRGGVAGLPSMVPDRIRRASLDF